MAGVRSSGLARRPGRSIHPDAMSCHVTLCPVRAAAAMPTLPKPGTGCRPAIPTLAGSPRDPQGVARGSHPG